MSSGATYAVRRMPYAVRRRRTRPRAIPLTLKKISRIDRLPCFLTHGALRARALRARAERRYDMGKNKGECDKEMVKSLDKIPYSEMPKWGSTARFLINTKQKLGLGVTKNVKRRWVVIGLNN